MMEDSLLKDGLIFLPKHTKIRVVNSLPPQGARVRILTGRDADEVGWIRVADLGTDAWMTSACLRRLFAGHGRRCLTQISATRPVVSAEPVTVRWVPASASTSGLPSLHP